MYSQQEDVWSKSVSSVKNNLIKPTYTPSYFQVELSQFKNQLPTNLNSKGLPAASSSKAIISFPI